MSSSSDPTTAEKQKSPFDLLPGNDNPWLARGGDLALYNTTLLLSSAGLLMHAVVFGLIFFLRRFSARRALDLHFLSIIFGLSLALAPVIFLLNRRIDMFKLSFFLEHEAIEFLIALRVLGARTRLVRRRPGLVLFGCWAGLSAITVAVTQNDKYRHAAEIVAWLATTSDACITLTGAVLVLRWATYDSRRRRRHPQALPISRPISTNPAAAMSAALSGPTAIKMARLKALEERRARFRRRKIAAEGMAGAAFILHGVAVLAVAPVFTGVLYARTDPKWFAYAWVATFYASFLACGLLTGVAGVFFGTVHWCCWHDRKTLPGEVGWEDDEQAGGDYGSGGDGGGVAVGDEESGGVGVGGGGLDLGDAEEREKMGVALELAVRRLKSGGYGVVQASHSRKASSTGGGVAFGVAL